MGGGLVIECQSCYKNFSFALLQAVINPTFGWIVHFCNEKICIYIREVQLRRRSCFTLMLLAVVEVTVILVVMFFLKVIGNSNVTLSQ
jgi:hypothetical protein